MINPRALSDSELVRYARSYLPQGLSLTWQLEVVKRLDERVHKHARAEEGPAITEFKQFDYC